MHERDVCSHRRQSYIFYTYYIHISCVFYAFLTHMYQSVEQPFPPSLALVLASSWLPRLLLAQRATSEERARKKRGTSAPVRQPSAVAVSRCRFASWAVDARRQVAGGGGWWRRFFGSAAGGRRGGLGLRCGGWCFGGQVVAAGVPKRRRLGVLCG